jgi:hypothetical protein
MSSIPINGRWSQRWRDSIDLDFPAVPFVAIHDDGGGHVTLTLTRYQAEQTRKVLHDLLTISEGGNNG